MAYSELIKNFSRIREYMREFYVYGFKRREEYTAKSARSYDDERRRMESYLGDYMGFRQTPEGKRVFISLDSRRVRHNPLYAAWKAKSFTDGDITLHFLLFDILDAPTTALSLADITAALDARLAAFPAPRLFDASTVRKKLGEYVSEGLVETEKRGKTLYYRRAADAPMRRRWTSFPRWRPAASSARTSWTKARRTRMCLPSSTITSQALSTARCCMRCSAPCRRSASSC